MPEFKIDDNLVEIVNPESNEVKLYHGTVTPDLAMVWLEFNTCNRKPKKSVVDRYVRAMKNGEWEDNYTPIRFKKDGTLQDGQHRLMAIKISGVSIPMAVYVGMDDTFHIDDGATRTTGDLIQLHDNLNNGDVRIKSHVVSVANFAIHLLKEGDERRLSKKVDPGVINAWIERHLNSCEFLVNDIGGNSQLKSQPVMLAIIASREAGVSDDILKSWAKAFSTSMYTDNDCGINGMKARQYYENNVKLKNVNIDKKEDIYKTCMHSICLMAKGVHLSSIRSCKVSDYPIPE